MMEKLPIEGVGLDTANSSILSDTAFLNDLRRQMVKFATLQLSNMLAPTEN
jgi:hypothetical protein